MLPIPNLDDRRFADLVAEGRAMIPRYAPEWTNYNPSDPGITLLELFAWLTEMILYRLNHVSEDNYRAFLDLIGVRRAVDETTESAIRRAIRSLGAHSRAVTLDDFEVLARHAASSAFKVLATKVDEQVGELRLEDFEVVAGEPATQIVRAKALADSNLDKTTPSAEGHVSVVILPSAQALGLGSAAVARTCAAWTTAVASERMRDLTRRVRQNLEPFRLLTTVIHIVAPEFVPVSLALEIVPTPDMVPADVLARVDTRIRTFLDAYEGGEAGTGWPFGRAVYRSELYQLMEAVTGVDHVKTLTFNSNPALNTIAVGKHQLVCVAALSVTV
jgi:hypothetical protein